MRRQPLPPPRRGRGITHDAHGLYERFERPVFAVCLRALGNRQEAEDVVQETFLNAWLALRRGVEPDTPLAWLLTIARNLCVSRRRASNARIQASHLDAMQDRLPAPQASADDLVELTRVLRRLPGRQRSAFLLYEIKGMSHREVAVELGVSYSAAVALVFRARRTLGESLVDGGSAKQTGLRTGLGSLVGMWKPALGGGGAFKVAVAALTAVPLALVPLVERDRPSGATAAPSVADVADHVSAPRALATARLRRLNVAASRSIAVVRTRPVAVATTAPPDARAWGRPDAEYTRSADSSSAGELPTPRPPSEAIDVRPPLTPAPDAGGTTGGAETEAGSPANEPDAKGGPPADPGSTGQGDGPPDDPGSQGQGDGPPDDAGAESDENEPSADHGQSDHSDGQENQGEPQDREKKNKGQAESD